MDDEKKARYDTSEQGNFYVRDTIGVPHPYCIGPKHIVHASDRFSGMLSKEAIIDAEKHGVKCGVHRCQLSYEQHQQALLIECVAPISGDDGRAVPELQDYLMKCKPLADEDGYVGFAFMEKK